jgi:hypothetical protein
VTTKNPCSGVSAEDPPTATSKRPGSTIRKGGRGVEVAHSVCVPTQGRVQVGAGLRACDGRDLHRHLAAGNHSPGEHAGERGTAWVDRTLRAAPLALRLTKLTLRAPRGAHPAIDDVAQAVLLETDDKSRRMGAFLKD